MEKNEQQYSIALVSLFKGIISQHKQPKIWNTILVERLQIESYVSKLGLTLIVQTQDGYAYLKQRVYENEEIEIPRLVARRQLGFQTSLLLVVLRKEFAQINRRDDGERIIVTEAEIIEKMQPYLIDTTDEVKQRANISRSLKQVLEMGFIQRLNNDQVQYEILPLIRGFVDGQWLEDFNQKLESYVRYQGLDNSSEEASDESI